MRSTSKRVRRAQPLLGTIVEVDAVVPDPAGTKAVDAAFDTVARVHRVMSAHDPASDVGRLNRFSAHTVVQVHPWTWQVLAIARQISAAAGGVFDVSVAPALAQFGYLPPIEHQVERGTGWRAIDLLPAYAVRFSESIAIDLGGIAKGFAVDRAADALRAHGVTDFVVNAGGDLRVGTGRETINVRHPARPSHLIPLAELSNTAVATSATYFAAKKWNGSLVHPIVVPHTGACAELDGSVTVLASECVVADALTKVVAILGEASGPVLARFGAEACVITHRGHVTRIFATAEAARMQRCAA